MVSRFLLIVLSAFQMTLFGAPSLDIASVNPDHTFTIRLRGDDSLDYSIETSSDLSSWTEGASLTTTNSFALFSQATDLGSRLFIRVRESVRTPTIVLQPEIAQDYAFPSLVGPDGGSVELFTPDHLRITLTIPPGCVTENQDFTMTVITNLAGLPFSRGYIAAVRLEPEDLSLSGVATLEISLPDTVTNLSEIASFTSNNDGTGFNVTLDMLGTNSVVMPISRFATYGTALASASEVDAMLSINGVQKKTKHLASKKWTSYGGDQLALSFFLTSSRECFPASVDRAIQVRSYLRQIRDCQFYPLIEAARLEARAKTNNEDEAMINSAITNLCTVIAPNVNPFWSEASDNCPVGEVLLEFVLSLTRTLELYGVTEARFPKCGLTIQENLSNICDNAKKCLEDIKACCQQGNKGMQKSSEIFKVISPLFYLGYSSCLPGFEDNPQVLDTISTCSSNAWIGRLQVTLSGSFSTNSVEITQVSSTRTTSTYQLSQSFKGLVYLSDESPFVNPELGGISLRLGILGDVAVQEHAFYQEVDQQKCGTNDTFTQISFTQTDNIGSTNQMLNSTNVVPFGPAFYVFDLLLMTNEYKLTVEPLSIRANYKQITGYWAEDSGQCVFAPSRTVDTNSSSFDYPSIVEPQYFPMPDTNTLFGTYNYTQTNILLSFDVPIKVEMTWSFHRQKP